MRIEFKQISIKNFKGVLAERTFTFNPTLTQILGANHTGKTTIVDAVRWVLFDKNSEGQTVFGIDPKDERGEIIHHLDNTVALELTADGTVYRLEKVRNETWSKPRQKDEAVMTGHATKYFINGNKYTQKDYKEFIDGICSEHLFKVLTMPSYFPSLPADEQRQLLTKMVSLPADEDIAGDNQDFKDLLQELAGTDIQKFREQLKYQIGELKKEIDTLPSRISENQEELQGLEADKPNFNFTRKRIQEIEKGIENIDRELADLSRTVDSEYDARTKERTEINKLKQQMQSIAQSYQDKSTDAERTYKRAVDDAQYKLDSTERAIRAAQVAVDEANNSLATIEIDKQDFKARWAKLEETTFAWDESQETCPTCHQRLPQGRIDELKEEMEGNFNQHKSDLFDKLDNEATLIKKRKADAEAVLHNNKDKLAEYEKTKADAEEELKMLKGTKPQPSYPTYDETYQRIQQEVVSRTAALEARQQTNATETREKQEMTLRQRKAEQNRLRDELRDELSKEQRIKDKQERIATLEEQQKKLSLQLTDLEKKDFTAEQFIIAKIEDLERKVNGLFAHVHFKMFESHITTNSIKTTCECTMHGTPYQDLSTSEKINAGIDIINACCSYCGTYAPLLIDNAESITDILPTRNQQILFIVSRDKELTIIE